MADNILQHPKFDDIAGQYESALGLPPGLLRSVAVQESGGRNIAAKNGDGGMGVFQFTDPSVIKFYNVDPKDPWDSLRAAAEYLGDGFKKYGSVEAALADFHRGPKAAQRVAKDGPTAIGNGPIERKYIPEVMGRLTPQQANAVQQSVIEGEGAMGQLTALRRAGLGAQVDEALRNGWPADEIVKRFASEEVQTAQAAKQRQDGLGTLGRTGEKLKNTGTDLVNYGNVLFAGSDEEKAAAQAAVQAQKNDINVRANDATTAGQVTGFGVKAAPAVAAAVATGGASLPVQVAAQAAAGAAGSALDRPETRGEAGTNALRDAAIGGASMGVAGLAEKGLSKVASSVLKHDPAVVAERQVVADAARAKGLPANAATLTERGKQFAEALPDNASIKAMQSKADDVIAGDIAEGLGLKGYTGAIDTNMLTVARDSIKQSLDDATSVTVKLNQGLKGDLDSLVNGTNNPLVKGIAGDTTVRQAAANVIKAIDDGTPVSGRWVQELASELKGVASNMGASAAERQTAGQMVGKLNKALTDSMTPDQAAKFNAANRQYANMKAVEKMVTASGDTGVVTPRQVLNSVKSGRFKNAFLKGEAPFQELGTTASQLLGPANGRGLGSMLGRAVGSGDSVLGAATVLEPTTGLPLLIGKKLTEKVLGKLATSENPLVVRALTGIDGGVKGIDPAVRKYIASALGAGLSTAAR